MSFQITLRDINEILKGRGLEERGKVQRFVTNEVVKRNDRYIPMVTGIMKNSVLVRGADVTYPQPYTADQYYRTRKTRSYDPLRGAYWFERMKNAESDSILRGAARLAGGKSK